MKINKKAFTLVELLVVVLIIGILAAIAVPQYQKAVKMSKLKSYLLLAKSLYLAEESYHLATGNYTDDISKLDISVDYTRKDEKDNRTVYYTSFGYFNLYNTLPQNDFHLFNNTLHFDYYGFRENPIPHYAACAGDDAVCSKFGGQIWITAANHWTKTNVYYMTKI